MKVFLGGTCNDSKWRNEIVPALKIDYFNPVVDDWTPECKLVEITERNNCDFCLYGITPEMKGVYSIAEAVDDSNKRPEKTILVLLEEYGGIRFGKEQWISLLSVRDMVKLNGASVFYSLKDATNYLNARAMCCNY